MPGLRVRLRRTKGRHRPSCHINGFGCGRAKDGSETRPAPPDLERRMPPLQAWLGWQHRWFKGLGGGQLNRSFPDGIGRGGVESVLMQPHVTDAAPCPGLGTIRFTLPG